jgi:hypothetical protein
MHLLLNKKQTIDVEAARKIIFRKNSPCKSLMLSMQKIGFQEIHIFCIALLGNLHSLIVLQEHHATFSAASCDYAIRRR